MCGTFASVSALLMTVGPPQRPTTFFDQAEDGIRDHCVTGVQTCALPICGRHDVNSTRCAAEKLRGRRQADRVDRAGKLSYRPAPASGARARQDLRSLKADDPRSHSARRMSSFSTFPLPFGQGGCFATATLLNRSAGAATRGTGGQSLEAIFTARFSTLGSRLVSMKELHDLIAAFATIGAIDGGGAFRLSAEPDW